MTISSLWGSRTPTVSVVRLCSVVLAGVLASAEAHALTLRTITDPVGNQQEWEYEEIVGVLRLTRQTDLTDNKSLLRSYDANGNLASRTDPEGNVTTYTYNGTNQKTQQTEAAGTAEERVTTYEYLSPDLDLVTRQTMPSIYTSTPGVVKETLTTYDTNLNPTSITVNGFDVAGNPVSRTTTYTYNAVGQVLTVDGPRTDVSDITTFAYYDCTTGGECGQLQSITNAAGHTTTFDSYDVGSQLLQKTDANGVVTSTTYDLRNRVTSIVATPPTGAGTARTTTYTYDNAGNLATATLPDGRIITYTYDAAHYLREIEDNLGNKVAYEYDLKGNRVRTEVINPDDTLVRETALTYDHRDAVVSIDQSGSLTVMVNDALGNPLAEQDPNQNPASLLEYDALNQLTQYTDAAGGVGNYQYDAQGNLVQVTAPNAATTQYVYDDLGNRLLEDSPDRGATDYVYDEAANLISVTDARGVVSNYSYDALNRVTTLDLPGTEEDITYVYDTCPLGIGKLCQVTDQSGITDYEYDAFGNIASETKDYDGELYTTAYTWDAADRIIAMTYPNGRIISYQRDAIGRIMSMDSSLSTTVQQVITDRTYRADGLVTSQTHGNGLVDTRNYDQQGRLLTQTIGGHETRDYTYDANGNVTAITRPMDPLQYEFDALDRLIAEYVDYTTPSPTATNNLSRWGYDENGNRITRTKGVAAQTPPGAGDCTPGGLCFEDGQRTRNYLYQVHSNRLIQNGNKDVLMDEAGNILSDRNGKRTFTYNQSGRLKAFYKDGQLKAENTYNANNQRTRQIRHLGSGSPASRTFLYFYDLDGNLISEYRNGKPLRDYLWADGVPVQRDRVKEQNTGGIVVKNTLAITTDHLNTPRIATNETNTIVWRWDSDGFGKGGVNKDPDGDGIKRNVRLRFPGQIADVGGLFYNWNRYYDPRTGRYVTSDPIGLDGGINTYLYTANNPLRYVDLSGLFYSCAFGFGSGCDEHYFKDSLSGKGSVFSNCYVCNAKCVIRFVGGPTGETAAKKSADTIARKYAETVAFQIGKHIASRAFLTSNAVTAGQLISCVAECKRSKACCD